MKRKKNPAIAHLLTRQFQDRDVPADSRITSVHTIGYHGEEQNKEKLACFGPSVKQKVEERAGGLHSLIKLQCPKNEKNYTLVRLSPDLFHDSLRHGVSLQQRFAERLQLYGLREVKIEVVDCKIDLLERVEITVRGRFLSKREIWNYHRHLLDLVSANRAPVLYLYNAPPESKFLFRAKVSHIRRKGASCLFGVMGKETQIKIRSKSAHIVMLLEISSELFYFSLIGEPYYERAIAYIREFMETLQEEDRSETNAHDFTIILFGRSARWHEGVESYVDWYDVLWEGHIRALPSPVDVATTIRDRIVFSEKAAIDQSSCECCFCADKYDTPTASFSPSHYYSCQEGASIEALHLALNNINQAHIERKLHITGHNIMLITANNGVLTCNNKRFWEMTQIRFKSTGVNCTMVCLREPPLHDVPLAILENIDDNNSKKREC